MGDVQQRPPDVGDQQVEQGRGLRREALELHVAVDEDGADLGRVHQILQIVVELGAVLHAQRELGVDGGELLVDRLQFLAAGLQLLGGRAQFLVDGLQFLVRGAQLLGEGGRFADRVAQAGLELQQLGLERLDHRIAFRALDQRQIEALAHLVEDDQHHPPRRFVEGRPHGHDHGMRHAVDDQAHARGLDARTGLRGPVDGGAQFDPQFRPDQLEQLVGRRALRHAQQVRRPLADVQHGVVLVDQDGRRRVLAQDALVQHLERRLRRHLAHQAYRPHVDIRDACRDRRQHARLGRLGIDAVDAPDLVDVLEVTLGGIDGLGAAHEQQPVQLQREVEAAQRLGLSGPVEVDQHVAAADQVHPREGRIAQQVVRGEDDAVAQLLVDAQAGVLLDEEALQPARLDVGRDRQREHAGTRRRHRALVDVGGEDLDLRPVRTQQLVQQDGDGIGLLAGGAAGHPGAEGLDAGPLLDQPAQRLAQGLEGVGVAEEVGDADQHVLQQRRRLAWLGVQELAVGGQVGDGVDLHPPLDAPQHRAARVVGEVVPGALAQDRLDGDQRLLGQHLGLAGRGQHFQLGGRMRQLQPAGVFPEQHQLGRHLLQREHEVDHAGLDGGAGHAVELGVLQALRDRDAAQLLDPAQPLRPIAAGARQHDAHGPLAMRLRQGAEEQVDGTATRLQREQGSDVQVPVAHDQLERGRDHVDVIDLDPHGFGDGPDRQRCRALQDRAEHALVLGAQMHHDDEGHARRGRHPLQQLLQRAQTARRGTDADDGEVEMALGDVEFFGICCA